MAPSVSRADPTANREAGSVEGLLVVARHYLLDVGAEPDEEVRRRVVEDAQIPVQPEDSFVAPVVDGFIAGPDARPRPERELARKGNVVTDRRPDPPSISWSNGALPVVYSNLTSRPMERLRATK
jgi:hypothetical protein